MQCPMINRNGKEYIKKKNVYIMELLWNTAEVKSLQSTMLQLRYIYIYIYIYEIKKKINYDHRKLEPQ